MECIYHVISGPQWTIGLVFMLSFELQKCNIQKMMFNCYLIQDNTIFFLFVL